MVFCFLLFLFAFLIECAAMLVPFQMTVSTLLLALVTDLCKQKCSFCAETWRSQAYHRQTNSVQAHSARSTCGQIEALQCEDSLKQCCQTVGYSRCRLCFWCRPADRQGHSGTGESPKDCPDSAGEGVDKWSCPNHIAFTNFETCHHYWCGFISLHTIIPYKWQSLQAPKGRGFLRALR